MDSSSSFGFGQGSYQSSITYQCITLTETRKRWLKSLLIILTVTNVLLLFSFTVLDMVKVVENRNLDKEFAVDIINDTRDFPAPLIVDIALEMMNPSYTFNIMVFFSVCFILPLLMYGVLTERKYEIYISLVITLITIAFLTPDLSLRNAWVLWYKKTRIFTTLCFVFLSIPITCKLVSEDIWLEFRVAGTSDGMMDLYRRLRYFNSLLHLDFFCVCVLAIFNISSGIGSSTADYIIGTTLLSYGAICLILGAMGVNREMKELVFSFAALSMVLLVWVPIQIRINSCFLGNKALNCNESQHLLSYCAVSAGILAILTRTYLMVELLKVYRNFGYGLTDSAFIGLVVGEASSLLVRR